MGTTLSRRSFLSLGALAAAGATAAGLSACSPAASANTSTSAQAPAQAETTASETAGNDWLGTAPETPDSFAEEIEADVVVCGLGISGVSALRAAAESGATVVGFDKAEATRSSNEMSAYGSSLYASRFPDVAKFWEGSEPLILNAVSEGCLYRNDIRILRHWMDINGDAVDWYIGAIPESEYSFGTSANGNKTDPEAEISCKEPVYPVPEHYDPATENMPCIPGSFRISGPKFLAANLEKAKAAGAQIYTFTPVIKLLTDESGAVTGVVAQNQDGEYIKATATKGVILTTGDFMNNEAMLRTFLPAVLDQGYVPGGPENLYGVVDANGEPCNVGDGHRMAAWIGAKIQDFGATMSHFSKSNNSSPFGTLPFLMLDENGQRFMNEDVQGQMFAERIRQLPNRRSILFFDSNFSNQAAWMPYGHGKLPYTTQAEVDKRVEDGLAYTSDTLEGLLDQLEIDKDAALKSIERYNELAKQGVDTDFGKVATRMFALENPPYYANYMTRGDDLVTMCGVVSDSQCHAYNTDNEIIPGLYVAGNMQGCRFATIYPEIFMGYSVAMAMAYGREAGMIVSAL